MLDIDPLVVENFEGSATPNKLLSVPLLSLSVTDGEVTAEDRLPNACDS